jgi:rhamnosyltransferase
VVRSHAFTNFWQRMVPLSDRTQVIRRYEVGLSQALQNAGFASGSYFTENEQDRRTARERVWWWAALRAQKESPRARYKTFSTLAREAWNPCAGLADRALDDARLPLVKIDTLRYDPYGLGAQRLLAACEQAHPDAFAGVRSFLEETAPMYPPRPKEALPVPSPVLRPFARRVRYA